MAYIYKGDDTGGFGGTFLTVYAKIPEGYAVSKAKIKIGNLPVFTYTDPVFPLQINLTSAQTRQLATQNECYMAVYDGAGRKRTLKGTLKFVAKDEVV